MKKVLLVVASKGFQPVEYSTPKRLLTEAGFEVVTVSDKAGLAIAKDNSTASVDMTVDQVDTESSDGLFFIGGPGALECLDNQTSYGLLRHWRDTGKPYGSICISTRILAKAGVLVDKKATGWNDDEALGDILEDNGATYVREPVVVDGHTVTAEDPQAAEEFGKRIIEVMLSYA